MYGSNISIDVVASMTIFVSFMKFKGIKAQLFEYIVYMVTKENISAT